MLFKDLQLIEPVLQALSKEGYTHPTPVQEKSIPVVLSGKDLLASAQTGTGKTAAFTIPMLQLMHQQQQTSGRRRSAPAGLILTPTRELAIQIGESITAYGRFLRLKHEVIFGGVSQFGQVKAIQAGIDILVATPGRLLDLMQQRLVSLNDIQFFVLDEADRMLDSGFINDVKKVIAKLPEKKQTLLFSATVPEPIQQLADRLLKDPVKVQVTPVSSTAEIIRQSVYFVEKKDKLALLVDVLKNESIETLLVFTQMKHAADKLSKSLVRAGIHAGAIHGNKSQNQRQDILKKFKERKLRVLVATDIAARGIDIDELSHVVNFDLPDVPETYVHRIGRTGRAGASGVAIAFCDHEEKILLNRIQQLTKKQLEVVEGHAYESTVAAHTPVVAQTAIQQKKKPHDQDRRRHFHSGRRQRTARQIS